MIRILIVDDHPLMRKGLVLSLTGEPDVKVVAQASNAEEALDALHAEDPDMAIVDISLPGMSGLELIKHMLALRPLLKILVVSRHDESLYAERAIRRVMNGGIYVSDEINERLLLGMATGRDGLVKSPLEVLSDRELEVFELTGRGYGTREIAEKLHLSVKTVESYRARIKNKLNLNSAAELMQHAVQWVEGEGAG